MADESEDQQATELVENYLKLGTFFNRHRDHILDKLEECDEIAQSANAHQAMIFFAESLPIIDGLIQVGTTRQEYRDALEEVKAEGKTLGPLVEPAQVVSVLTFL